MTLNPYKHNLIKGAVKIKSYVTTAIKYAWYVFESRSIQSSSNLLAIQYSYMYAQIGIMHLINGLILKRVTLRLLAKKTYQLT